MSSTFLPDRFRPHAPRRASRRPLLALALAPMALALLPLWRVQAVDVSGCADVPAVVRDSLEDLEGRPAVTVSPQWVRRQLEMWPEVATVEVRLELPSTLKVSAKRTVPHGSAAIGRGWYAITELGAVGGRLDGPIFPVIEDISCSPLEMRRALAVSRRIQEATGGQVESVRLVTPSAYEVRLRPAHEERQVIMHVGPDATDAERYWAARVAAGDAPANWVDLRWDDRVVLGGVG